MLALACALVLTLLAVPDRAVAQDYVAQDYTVERIPVDVTAETAALARDKALLDAEREGLNRLAERFGADPPDLGGAQVADFVESIEILNEKSSAVRYIAEITVHYRPPAIDRLFNRGGAVAALPSDGATAGFDVGPAARPGDAVLVLPVYEWSGARSIWDRSNPWFAAWMMANPDIAGRPVLLPEGGLDDRAALSADQAVAGDRAAIAALGHRYGAADILVAHAIYEIDHRTGRPQFRISLTGFGNRLGGAALVERIDGEPTEFVDELALRAVREVAAATDRGWGTPPRPAEPTVALIPPGPQSLAPPPAEAVPDDGSPLAPDRLEHSLLITVELRGPADLAALRSQMDRLPMVARDDLVSLSRDRATLRVHYRGGADRLRLALTESGFRVDQAGAGWSLRRADAAGRGSAASPVAQPAVR